MPFAKNTAPADRRQAVDHGSLQAGELVSTIRLQSKSIAGGRTTKSPLEFVRSCPQGARCEQRSRGRGRADNEKRGARQGGKGFG